MASDLLTKIRGEIQQRLDELRPLMLEHERLLTVERSLDATAQATPPRTAKRAAKKPRGGASSTAGTVKRTASKPRPKQKRATDHAGGAILDALEHGSHTVSELVMVTAVSASKIRGSIRRLLAAEQIQRVDRDGKTAYVRSADSTRN